MEQTSISTNHNIAIVPIFNLQQITYNTVPNQRMNEIRESFSIFVNKSDAPTFLSQLIDSNCIFYVLNQPRIVG